MQSPTIVASMEQVLMTNTNKEARESDHESGSDTDYTDESSDSTEDDPKLAGEVVPEDEVGEGENKGGRKGKVKRSEKRARGKVGRATVNEMRRSNNKATKRKDVHESDTDAECFPLSYSPFIEPFPHSRSPPLSSLVRVH